MLKLELSGLITLHTGLKLPNPAHFHEVALEVPQLRIGCADLVGKHDLGAEAEHCQRPVQQRGRQDAGLVLAGGVIGDERKPVAFVIGAAELSPVACLSAHDLTIAP